MRQRQAVRGRRDDRATLVHKHGFHAGRADVDSQKHELSSLRAPTRPAISVAFSVTDLFPDQRVAGGPRCRRLGVRFPSASATLPLAHPATLTEVF